jgi:LysR family transcriptional regulator, carnitine catabolism transcriptional activator
VVVPRDHPLDRKKRIVLEDLTRFPLILLDSTTSVRALVDRAFESIGHLVVPAYETEIMATAIGLVKAGLGIALLPSSIAFEGGPLTGLRVRAIKHDGLIRPIGVIQQAGRSLSPAAEQFVRVMREACKTLRVCQAGSPLFSRRKIPRRRFVA